MTTYFVTGTDTDVGKTVASAFLVHKLNAFYWKPVQSGIIDIFDKDEVEKFADLPKERILPSAYELNEPLSPHEAARIDGVEIEMDKIVKPSINAPLVIEGAGGVLVPLNDDDMMIDLIKKLDCPTIVVARSGLGTINHTLLTLKALRDADIEIAGVILNGEPNEKNRQAIEQFGDVSVIAELPKLQEISTKELDKIEITL